MATNSPPPNTAPSPPHSSSPPPTFSPTANPPDPTTPSTPSPPIAPSPSQNSSPPPLTSIPSPPFPQQTISPTSTPPPPPPPSNSTPRATNPPMSSTPPPSNSPSPTPPVSSSPPSSPPLPPPPAVSNPPTRSPPPPVPNPPPSSLPPVRNPPPSSPPPPSNPPPSSPPLQPPSPTPSPPPNSPPSPPSDPTTSSPPPPAPSSSPPPVPNPPTSSPPPPVPVPNPPRSSAPPPSNPPMSSPPPRPPPPPPRNSTPSPPSDPTASSPPRTQPSSSPPSQPLPNSTPSPAESSSPSKSSPNWSPPPPMRQLSPSPGVPVSSLDNRPGTGSNSPSTNGLETVSVVVIAVAAGIVALILIGLVVWCLRRRRKEISGFNGVYVMPAPMVSSSRSDSSYIKTQSSAPLIGSGSGSDFVNSPKESSGLTNSRSFFTYEELIEATNGFSVRNLLGEGGFGSVYKGYLPDGREVAIKRLKMGGGQGEREFKAEVDIISRIHHRHLVSLVGYCISENQRLLIYDYVPNNTLYFHLHGEWQPALDWSTRVKIAVGAARGIAYLHEDCDPRIIHRDIKSSNILLDNNFEARVSDFGLAKLSLDANTHVTTRVVGTFGYMAPEYASSGKLTEKSDVFSFGVVLLELITGRKPVDASQPIGDESLVEWSRPLLSHALNNEEFDGLTDPRLGKNFIESEMFRMIEAAAACVRHSAAKRPGMGQVVRALDSLATSDLTNGMRVGESEAFNSAQQSSEIRWFRRMAFGSQNYSTDFFSQGSLDS